MIGRHVSVVELGLYELTTILHERLVAAGLTPGTEEWRGRMEAAARQRNWPHPEGPGKEDMVWPPYQVLRADAQTA